MAKSSNQKEKIPSKYLPTKFALTARLLVGAYLLYTSYSLIDGVVNGEGRDKYFLGIFMIAFTVIGILLIVFAGRGLLQGRYAGGELDAGEEETADPAVIDSEMTGQETVNSEAIEKKTAEPEAAEPEPGEKRD